MKVKLFLALFLPIIVFAESNVFSNIPPAKIEIININPEKCNKSCLLDLSKEKKILSFIARFDKTIDDEELQSLMEEYSKEIGIYYRFRFDPLGKRLEIALLIPKKIIGKYSTTTIDTILAYLVSRNIDFRFKVFDSIDENLDSLSRVIDLIDDEHFNFLIAVLSKKESLSVLENINMPIYIPTIAKDSNFVQSNIVFGGIDYKTQIDSLLKEVEGEIIIAYNDDSALGEMLGEITKDAAFQSEINFMQDIITNKVAANFSSNLRREEENIPKSSLFLNTPVVKSGLLLSQINFLKDKPLKILSTQVNYNSSFLSLLRGIDTSNIIIASSIGESPQILLEYGYLLSSDIKYDWVSYSTALGIDLFLNNMSSNIERYFLEDFNNNQAIYNINLYGIQNAVFIKF